MKVRRRAWRGVALSVCVVAATAGVAFSIATLAGITVGGPGSAQEGSGGQLVSTLLRTANRERLAICVDALGFGTTDAPGSEQAIESAAKAEIEGALAEVVQHPGWQQSGLAGKAPPVVDAGCPAPPATPLMPGSGPPVDTIEGRVVSEASYYQHFVFILPPADLAEVVGASPKRQVGQEKICDGDVCVQVTFGLYLTPGEVGDATFLVDMLEKATGLEVFDYLGGGSSQP